MTLEEARREAEQQFSDALVSIGISLHQVRLQAGEAFEMRNPSNRRIPFSPQAKKALEQALREALGLGHNQITGEHILLGVLRDEHGQAARILAGLGVSTQELEYRLDRLRTLVSQR